MVGLVFAVLQMLVIMLVRGWGPVYKCLTQHCYNQFNSSLPLHITLCTCFQTACCPHMFPALLCILAVDDVVVALVVSSSTAAVAVALRRLVWPSLLSTVGRASLPLPVGSILVGMFVVVASAATIAAEDSKLRWLAVVARGVCSSGVA